MKKNVEIDRIYFIEYCESAKQKAVILAAAFAESLKLYELKTQGRLRRVDSEIDHIFEERKVLNRPLYIQYVLDLTTLFELFERMNYLHNPEEMAKLQQAINWVEKFHRLELLIIETFAMEEVENFKEKELALKAMGKKKSFKEISVMPKEDDHPHEPTPTSLMGSTKPIRKLSLKQSSFEYLMPEGFLIPYVIKMCKFHLLDPKTSEEDFIRYITCKDWTKVEGKIYLNCHTNEFKCFIIHLKHYFNSLSWANIGRSELFVSKSGHLITSSDLTSAKIDKLRTKDDIGRIFRN